MKTLGLDTSNYTTSTALFDGARADGRQRLLDVRPGELGLRQSDALFAHVKRLPELMALLFDGVVRGELRAVGASTRPRAVDGSYMPCFLAGASQAQCLAETLGLPFYAFSHQQGHIAAALFSAGRMTLLEKPFLSWHLSGGTTELLRCEGHGSTIIAERIGGTTDLAAGQLIDRCGRMLGLPFPAGRALDSLCAGMQEGETFRVKTNGLEFSLSGLENQARRFYEKSVDAAQTAYFSLRAVMDAVVRATEAALREYPDLPVVFSGGVSANSILRSLCGKFDAVFAEPALATDNAVGIAVLTWLQEESSGNTGI